MVTECFFNLFLEVLRLDELEQFKFKLENFFGIEKHAGKVRKRFFLTGFMGFMEKAVCFNSTV